MEVDAGTVVRGRVWDTRSGRRPLSRVAACLAHHDTARLVGTALPAHACNDDAVGRGLARRDARGPRPRVTAWAVRAVTRVGVERRDVHGETTARRVWGADPLAEAPDVPCSVTSGDRPEKRPDRQPWVRSMRGVDRAVPRWGTPADGHAAANTRQPRRWSESAPLLARHGGPPGASIDRADAAWVTADPRAALGDRVCLPR